MITLAQQIAAVREAAEKVNPEKDSETHEALFEAYRTLLREANQRHSFRRVKDLERVVRDQAAHIRLLEEQVRPGLVRQLEGEVGDAIVAEVLEGQEPML